MSKIREHEKSFPFFFCLRRSCFVAVKALSHFYFVLFLILPTLKLRKRDRNFIQFRFFFFFFNPFHPQSLTSTSISQIDAKKPYTRIFIYLLSNQHFIAQRNYLTETKNAIFEVVQYLLQESLIKLRYHRFLLTV